MPRLVLKAEEVRRIRVGRAMSQADLADKAGVRQATISNAERGHHLRYATIAAIAGALAVEVSMIADVVE